MNNVLGSFRRPGHICDGNDVFSGAFEEKCPTLTVAIFFKRVRSTFLFIC